MVLVIVLLVFVCVLGECELFCVVMSIVLLVGVWYFNGIVYVVDGMLYVGLVISGCILCKFFGGEWEIFFVGSLVIFVVIVLWLDELCGLFWGNLLDFLFVGWCWLYGVFVLDFVIGVVC